MAGEKQYERAYFAAGCFWGVEAAFREVKGVVETAVGFMGGRTVNPTYEEVCTGRTGHAETVEVVFDPEVVGYADLLDIFWDIHDPTTKNRQGPDIGSQYRSAIFFLTPAQEAAALASRERLERSGRYPRPIVTEIVPAGPFFRAEEYHQRYYAKKGVGGCRIR
ncbi:peptide-methionine (S)-S-oxide reductase MsrA [Methanofollis sp. UBA420]|jgi:peptide-methionine (S)-S-oxide reductase|uniref:peptide-methionine (S)-S-oxide reductase MsrA n=1 Tax=Methanofollis sp. UBA420 TaxID=1915514 RepID=UPI00316AE737